MICKVKQINIIDMLDMYGEDSCKEILSTFICPLNMDVADFIHNKAIEFAKQRIAITFLVFCETEKGNVMAGYYTLANKFVAVSANMLSKTLRKRIVKFSQYDAALDRYLISMPLIAQLGRNYSKTAREYPISGNDLLDLASQNIMKVQHIIGGKMTYIECASNPRYMNFIQEIILWHLGNASAKMTNWQTVQRWCRCYDILIHRTGSQGFRD